MTQSANSQIHRRGLDRRVFSSGKAELEQVHRGGRERLHLGGFDPLRQLPGQLGQPLAEHLPGDEDVRTVAEDRGDNRQSLNRLRSHGLQVADAAHDRFDRACDERLDLFGRETWRLALDDDLRRHKLREECPA